VDIDEDTLRSALANCRLNHLSMDLYLASEEGEESFLSSNNPSNTSHIHSFIYNN
jgi:ribosomal protein L11 methylase PrmA